MGIKGLMTFLKKKCPKCIVDIPLTEFSEKSIAVDSFHFMFTYLSSAQKRVVNSTDVLLEEVDENEVNKEWLFLSLQCINGFFRHNIKLVFVFDGESPKEKFETKADRKNTTMKYEEKLNELNKAIKDGDLFSITEDIIENKKKYLRSIVKIGKHRVNLFKSFLKELGIPVLQAKGEGERLCSMLAREKKVHAVLSTDTDNLALGCYFLLTKRSKCVDDVIYYTCIRYVSILKTLKINRSFFLDLCIMSGCDFNNNIPGIGVCKSFKLLKKFGNVRSLNINIDSLNYERCLELLSVCPSSELITEGSLKYDVETFNLKGFDALCKHQMGYMFSNIQKTVNNFD